MAKMATPNSSAALDRWRLRPGRRHMAGACLLSLALALAGCVNYRVDRPSGLNTGLCYLPWMDRPDCTPRTPNNLVTITPGMKIVAREAQFFQFKANVLPAVLAGYEWIYPQPDGAGQVRYSQEDFFFFSYILSAGIPDCTPPGIDRSATLKHVGDSLSGPDFYHQLAERALAPAFKTLQLKSTRKGTTWDSCGDHCTATFVRQWLAEPGKDDLPDVVPSEPPFQQTLQIDVTDPGDATAPSSTNTYALFNGSSGFFFEHPAPMITKGCNPWYRNNSETYPLRAHLELEIPVRLQGEVASRYVPIYWSVDDLERRFNVVVLGLRRKKEYLGPLPTKDHLCNDHGRIEQSCFLANDHYFTLNFDDHIRRFGARGSLTVDGRLKSDLLLAPGDVVLMAGGSAATDLPGSR